MRFFLIDRITRWEVGALAEASKNVALSEDFFDDHFPRRPVMPGVLILEGMAQLSGLLLEASLMQKYGKSAKAVVIVLERTKFRSLVKPGDTLIYRAEVVSVNEAGGKVKGSALRAGSLVTSTEMVFAFKYVDDPQLDEKRRRLHGDLDERRRTQSPDVKSADRQSVVITGIGMVTPLGSNPTEVLRQIRGRGFGCGVADGI